jgi:drug/metabolite transporter (DMT)-like permease
LDVFFVDVLEPKTNKLLMPNFIHLVIRSVTFFRLNWLTIIGAQYALLAKVNFGVIASCINICTPLNCLLGAYFWGERLSLKTLIGTFIVVAGVVTVSFAKNRRPDSS